MKEISANNKNAEHSSVNRGVGLLTLSIATLGANSLGFGPIASGIAADLGVGVARIMLAAGGYGIATALGALFLSPLIDRFGVGPVLGRALIMVALAFGLSALAPNTAVLIAAQGLAGIAAGLALPAIYALAAQISPPGRESVILGRVLFGWTISMVGGVVLTTTIAEQAHWRLVFVFLACVAALAGWLVSRVAASPHPDGSASGRPLTKPTPPWRAARIPGVTRLLVACLAAMTTFYGTYGYIGDHINRVLDLPLSATGILALVYGVGFGLAVFGDHLIDRFGARRILPLCFCGVAAVYAALGLFSGFYAGLVLAAFLWGVLNHFALNLIVSGLSAIDAARRGAILGLNSAVTYLAASIGAIAFGPLYTAWGFTAVALASAAIMAASVVYLAARPAKEGKLFMDSAAP